MIIINCSRIDQSHDWCFNRQNQLQQIKLGGLPSTVMPASAYCDADLYPLMQKPNQCARYISDLILVKLAPIVIKIVYSPCCDLDLCPFDPKI